MLQAIGLRLLGPMPAKLPVTVAAFGESGLQSLQAGRINIEDAVAAAEVQLSSGEVARLEEFYRPRPVRGHT